MQARLYLFSEATLSTVSPALFLFCLILKKPYLISFMVCGFIATFGVGYKLDTLHSIFFGAFFIALI